MQYLWAILILAVACILFGYWEYRQGNPECSKEACDGCELAGHCDSFSFHHRDVTGNRLSDRGSKAGSTLFRV